ncbi:chemotaxis protein CheB [Deinococcus sonorensis]|uniref:protein-glutamate O-methyltransferase n=2 Tax=Deinococcus sonorensis TaxID=309891 RepID=A0AAU7UDP6_9DEIO
MSDNQGSTPSLPAPAEALEGSPPKAARPAAVVGIGGSAGALDGFERFFLGLPPGSGMAFVVVSHLSPTGESFMPELLTRCTSLPVRVIEDGMVLEPDHVYVAHGATSLAIVNGTLILQDLGLARGHTIDAFLSSLADDQQERAVAVILSGMGKDGTDGARRVKERGGLLLTQDPASADYPSMPASAVATGLADAVLPPDELAARLYQLMTNERPLSDGVASGEINPDLQRVLLLVRSHTGQDFTRYKSTTLLRRIDRRMKTCGIGALAEYMGYLQQHPAEIEALFEDLTINVTSFFRDPEAFERLKELLRTQMMGRPHNGDVFRVWVVGCASGEEAYSVAILLHELVQEPQFQGPLTLQVFATDIDQRSINVARLGQYSHAIEQSVSPARLQRYFTRNPDGYQVSSLIRETVVFALHNTFNDPPFTRLDLLCCRNMLIYLNPDLQQQVLAVFQYALRPDGLLFLGASESTGLRDENFLPVDPRWKIYRRGPGAPGSLPVGHNYGSRVLNQGTTDRERRPVRSITLVQHIHSLLLANYTAPAVVVNEHGDMLYVNGRTGRYLELPSGSSATNNVIDMTRDGLRFELSSALRRAAHEQRAVVLREMRYPVGDDLVTLDVTVRPISHPDAQDVLMIVFQERSAHDFVEAPPPEQLDQVQALGRELHHLRETLQATIEEYQTSIEELKSTNEEHQTTIEELKSTNEELMTSKEELQSVNEELITTNVEHQSVIHELTQANDDMKNLLESAGIATLFLGNDLRIKRYTSQITRVISLIPSDVGRHIGDIRVKLEGITFEDEVKRVLSTLMPLEVEAQAADGRWYLVRINPYRTSDNFIDGVVVVCTNIDTLKTLESQLDRSSLNSEALLNAIRLPMLVLDDDLKLITANRALYELLRVSPEQARGQRLFDLGSRQFDLWELRERLQDMIVTDVPLTQYVLDLDVPGHGVQKMKVEAWPVLSPDGSAAEHLMTLENVTAIVHAVSQEGEAFTGPATDLDPDS